jgi:two-component sensor histidine kinase
LVKVINRIATSPEELWGRTASALASAQMAAEVSSAGWRKPVGEQYAARGFIDLLYGHGVPVTMASDAHRLEDVAYRFDDLALILEDVGYDATCGFEARSRRSEPLRAATGSRRVEDATATAMRGLPGHSRSAGRGDRLPGAPSFFDTDQVAQVTTDDADTHIQRLTASWAVLADLSFADLVLLIPLVGVDDLRSFTVAAQIRPNTSQTLFQEDLVGSVLEGKSASLPAAAWRDAHITRGEVSLEGLDEPVRMSCVPVRSGNQVLAVLGKLTPLHTARRRSGELERVYVQVADRLSNMIAEGVFPYPGEEIGLGAEAPRVGDGLVLLNPAGEVENVSPNVINALHRMGISTNAVGKRLSDIGMKETAVERALSLRFPVVEEVECRPDVTVLIQCTPLLASGELTGGIVLMRDVTDLRRLGRLLLSKDAAIREVHHRVKNNLQTISALLRLQARRLAGREGRLALEEAERRIRSIAIVHEVLSRDPGDQVAFDQIVRYLVRMAEDSVISSGGVEVLVSGDAGEVAGDIATPLALALAELLQNAVEHAFEHPSGTNERPSGTNISRRGAAGHIWVTLANDGRTIKIEIRDDGCGIPDDLDIATTSSLGLSIVRDLITSQLNGAIAMYPVVDHHGTVIRVEVPTGSPRTDLLGFSDFA